MNIKVFAFGRLTRDTELIRSSSGTAICKGSIASDFGYGDKKDTIFIEFVAFGKTAEMINEYHSKGDAIVLDGELQMNKWEGKDGVKHEKPQIKVDGFQFVPKAKGAKSAEAPESDDHGAVPF